MSFAFFGNYIRAWDTEKPTIATIGPFFDEWRLVVELVTIPYDGGDHAHQWSLCMTTAMMIRRYSML
jgi:hypothetical protein